MMSQHKHQNMKKIFLTCKNNMGWMQLTTQGSEGGQEILCCSI